VLRKNFSVLLPHYRNMKSQMTDRTMYRTGTRSGGVFVENIEKKNNHYWNKNERLPDIQLSEAVYKSP
jgi:hypothetical protein